MAQAEPPRTFEGPEDLDVWHAQVVEEPLEPDLPIIDAHHHFQEPRDPSRPPPKRPDIKAINMFGERTHFTKKWWAAEFQNTGHNIIKTVFLQAGLKYDMKAEPMWRPLGEVKHMQGISDATKNTHIANTHVCAAIIGGADLGFGKAIEPVLLEMMKCSSEFRGIRASNLGYWGPDGKPHPELPSLGARKGLYADPKFREGVAVLHRLGLILEVCCMHPSLDEVADLARAFPDLTIVLDHIGFPIGVGPYAGKREEVFSNEWKPAIARVAACPNVVVKLGGIMAINGFGFEKRAKPPTSEEVADVLGPYYRFCIEMFGASRCLFESNFHVDRASVSYVVLWNAFKRITRGYSPAARATLFAGTAARVYKIDMGESKL